jgi:hypothetical protein
LRGWGARDRAVRMVFAHGHPVGPHEQRPFRRLFYTPYWITLELPAIDMKVASVALLDQIATGLRWWILRKSPAGHSRTSGWRPRES